MSMRLQAMGVPKYRDGFNVRIHEAMLSEPFSWRSPKLVFVNSMSDLFHPEVPENFIRRVFDVMEETPQHRYQVLTKRADRLLDLAENLPWPKNVWMGVSVESKAYKFRIDRLREVPAAVRFLSLEPLIRSLGELNLNNIHWVIVGGESGPGARPMQEGWVRDIQRQCVEQDVPFFFKQWGGVNKKKSGRKLNDRTYDEMPALTGISTSL
jgi:protein gp37